MEIKANHPSLTSWMDVPEKSDFPIQNIPFGIISTEGKGKRAATRIGDTVIDLEALAARGYLDELEFDKGVFSQSVLNDFMAMGRIECRKVRERISELFRSYHHEIQNNEADREAILYPVAEVTLHMPVYVRDYTDFYSSLDHATNVGIMFRGKENALMPNWKWLPVGYHGRASSIVESGVPLHRPKGQTRPDPEKDPVYGPSRLVDFELEVAFITCKATQLGETISTSQADEHIFGMVLFNDWSARDIQGWEYVPLGPFLGKNWGSSISPWVVTLDALEPFRVPGYKQDPEVLSYLEYEGEKNIDIQLEAIIQPEGGEGTTVCRSNYKFMYWNMNQQLAHHTVNGCNINVGDMYASGTISGPTEDAFGSMLELSWRGSKPVKMNDGSERKFINDHDYVIMRGHAEKDGVRVGFGEVRTQLLPAK